MLKAQARLDKIRTGNEALENCTQVKRTGYAERIIKEEMEAGNL